MCRFVVFKWLADRNDNHLEISSLKYRKLFTNKRNGFIISIDISGIISLSKSVNLCEKQLKTSPTDCGLDLNTLNRIGLQNRLSASLQRIKNPTSTSVLYMTKIRPMVSLQSRNSGDSKVLLHCNYSQVHSDLEW